MDVMCIAPIVFICGGVFVAVLMMVIVNEARLLTRNLNPFSREAVVR
jgi:hypothetical protein